MQNKIVRFLRIASVFLCLWAGSTNVGAQQHSPSPLHSQLHDSANATHSKQGLFGVRFGTGTRVTSELGAKWWLFEHSALVAGMQLGYRIFSPAGFIIDLGFMSSLGGSVQYEWHPAVAVPALSPYIGVSVSAFNSTTLGVLDVGRSSRTSISLLGGAEYFIVPSFSVSAQTGLSWHSLQMDNNYRVATSDGVYLSAELIFTLYF